MYRTKIVKKKTKNRETLLRNLRKGKARKEARCAFDVIPHPLKFTGFPELYRLYADVILMEQNNNLTFESSLFNHFKLYKQAQIVNYATQKAIKFKMENQNVPTVDWRRLLDKLSTSNSLQQWINPVKNYCERYESLIQKFQEGFTEERIIAMEESNTKMENIRQTLMKTYPCIEFKSMLKDGQINVSEMSFSEKYCSELGFTLDEFSSVVFEEGLPQISPLTGSGASSFAKLRLEKYLTFDQDGYQTPEFETYFIMKGGYMKKVKLKVLYHPCYEKGVPGFVIIGVVVAHQRPAYIAPHLQGLKLNTEFVDYMTNKEQEANQFLTAYYGEELEPKYSNLPKTCTIREIGDGSQA